MNFKSLCRFIHTTPLIYSVEQKPLAILRKKTGYTFANCKKALDLYQNDIAKAEQWLHEQAQALGWAKAVKLQGRITQQGLVGVLVKKNIGAMVEVNCETDFVARNTVFQQFVESASMACIQHVSKMPTNDLLSKIDFGADGLRAMQGLEGKSLGDELALMIGSVGENASLRRATCFKAAEPITLFGGSHPLTTTSSGVHLGTYGGMFAWKSAGDAAVDADLLKNICTHIIGLNPSKVGAIDIDKPNEDKDAEKCLIHQGYLMDETQTVGELFKENAIEVLDFNRFRCGEETETSAEHLNVAKANN
ncbi:elongation factor Ts, mitochondrial [Bradysia coprophila]|uniref:elongation factor Ts, mitochondrial n=1 Tax=Bradysia coprophila TaxID=38358 RepID=UPI00187D78BA|nr:elongation factor Ts, mitochondrial [Bradysia coprophila]